MPGSEPAGPARCQAPQARHTREPACGHRSCRPCSAEEQATRGRQLGLSASSGSASCPASEAAAGASAHLDGLRARAHKSDALLLAALNKSGVLTEKAIARVDAVHLPTHTQSISCTHSPATSSSRAGRAPIFPPVDPNQQSANCPLTGAMSSPDLNYTACKQVNAFPELRITGSLDGPGTPTACTRGWQGDQNGERWRMGALSAPWPA